MDKVAIGIAYHKKTTFYKEEPYIPIQVGAYGKEDLGIQKDSDGDNISSMNAYCSEVSATYWLWKNVQADYKGLFHYRRFLSFKKESFVSKIPRWLIYYLSKLLSPFVKDARYSLPKFSLRHICEDDIPDELEGFAKELYTDIEKKQVDCYTMGPVQRSTQRFKTQLCSAIGHWHYDYAYKLIKKEEPCFFKYYEKAMNSNKGYCYNIIIASNQLFNEYCEILFNILEKYHSYMNAGLPEGTQNNALLRDSGYLAEMITDAFILMIKDRGCKVRHLGETEVVIPTSSESQHIDTVWKRIKDIIS